MATPKDKQKDEEKDETPVKKTVTKEQIDAFTKDGKKTREQIDKFIATGVGLIAAFFALALIPSASAQFPTYVPETKLTKTYTNALNFASNINLTIDCGKQQNIALCFKVQWGSTEASNRAYYPYFRSVDGTTATRETIQAGTITVTNAGAAAYILCTNLNVGGFGYLHFPYVTNFSTDDAITNTITAGTKISSP